MTLLRFCCKSMMLNEALAFKPLRQRILKLIDNFFLYFNIPCKYCGLRDFINYTCMPCICIKTGSLVLCLFGITVWEIADLIRIMSFKALDKNGMPLDYFF